MRRRIVYINLLILLGVVLLGMQHISAWENFKREHNLSQIIRAAGGMPLEPRSLGLENVDPTRPFPEFMLIAEKNLFSQDRSSSQAAEGPSAAADATPPKWAARPILHGVSDVGGNRQAVMTVFEGNQRNSTFRTVKVGAKVQGFDVEEIGDSVVKLRWNDREEIIDLADASEVKQPKAQGAKPAQSAVTVITVGSVPRGTRGAAGRTVRTTEQGQQERGIDVAVVGGRPAQAGAGRAAGQGAQPGGQLNQGRAGTVAPSRGVSGAAGGRIDPRTNRRGARARPTR